MFIQGDIYMKVTFVDVDRDTHKRESGKISLVILDLVMPKMSSQKCLEEILKVNPTSKVLIATGVSSADEQAGRMIGSGAMGIIHKPFDKNDLCRVARDTLDRD
jgi:DNA-binding NtrC family response regulator